MNIALSRYKKYNMAELKQAILSLSQFILTPEAANSFLGMVPSPDELEIAKCNETPLQHLDLASQFYCMISDIPRYQIRLRAVLFIILK